MAFAPINRIIPFSAVDGPSSRTAIFFQGCNLSCSYCHNPETQRLCTGCCRCVDSCAQEALLQLDGGIRWSDAKCIQCDRCIAVCLNYASPKAQMRSVDRLITELEGYRPFIRGITVSGGECMLYPDFLLELLQKVGEWGIGGLLDSNGTVDFTAYPELLELCEGVMLDVKAWSPDEFCALTGGKVGTVKENLVLLAERDKLAQLRLVCLDQVDCEAVLEGAAGLLGAKRQEIHLALIAFRPQGVRSGLEAQPATSSARMGELERLARSLGFCNITVK